MSTMSTLPIGYTMSTLLSVAAEEDGEDYDPALLSPHLSKAALLCPHTMSPYKNKKQSVKVKLSSSRRQKGGRLLVSSDRSTLNNDDDDNNKDSKPYVVNETSFSCFDLVDEDLLLWNNNNYDTSSVCDMTVTSNNSSSTSSSSLTTTTTAGTSVATTSTTRRSSSSSSTVWNNSEKVVRFHHEHPTTTQPSTTIYSIPNRDDYTPEEIQNIWYQEIDIIRMRKIAQEEKLQERQKELDDLRPWSCHTSTSTTSPRRGEKKKEQLPLVAQQERRCVSSSSSSSRYVSALGCVLEEQERQRLCSYGSSGAITYGTIEQRGSGCGGTQVLLDHELIRQLYRSHSVPAAKDARIIARRQQRGLISSKR